MATVSIAFIRGLLLSAVMVGMAGCETLEGLRANLNASPEASPADTASSQTGASVGPSGSTKATAGQTVTCDAPNYLGKITWQGEEARMTFGRKPSETSVKETSPVSILSNADGSTTYGYKGGDIIVYLRAYADGSCLLQTLGNQGNVTVEEFGRTSFVSSSNPSNGGAEISAQPATVQPASAQPASAAVPVAAAAPAVPSPTLPLSNPAAEQPIAQAKPAGAALSCPGTIKNTVDFTAYFAPDAGFNRVVFRPRESKVAVVSTLSYNGKNPQGQDTWHGRANEVADVTLVHLSASNPQRGDQIAVDYDGLAGQGVCQ